MAKLTIVTKCRHTYVHYDISNVRTSKNELRWINAKKEKRSMALAFIEDYELDS